MTTPVLSRPRTGRIIGGVCAGLARRFGWNPYFVRLLALLSCLIPGPQFVIYLVMWVIVPLEPAAGYGPTTQL